MPILVYVKQDNDSLKLTRAAIYTAVGRVFRTLRELRELRLAIIFLAVYWLYIDGVGTVIRMALDYLTGSPRLAILSLLVLFVGGFLLLLSVRVPPKTSAAINDPKQALNLY